MSKPCFYASQVSALIGRHRYKTREVALLESVRNRPVGRSTSRNDDIVRTAYANLAKETTATKELVQLEEVVQRASFARQQCVRPEDVTALTESAAASASKLRVLAQETRATALQMEQDACALTASIVPGTPGNAPAITRAHELHQQSSNMVEKAVAQEDKSAVLESMAKQPEVLSGLVEQLICKKRGREEETAVLDSAAKRHCSPVTARNTKKGRLEEPDFVVVGMCDGIMEDGVGVIEVKKRRNWFKAPPEYDIIQLRIYLRMYGLPRGMLLEEQMNGELRRETVVENSDEEWEKIRAALSIAASAITSAKPEDLRVWANNVH